MSENVPLVLKFGGSNFRADALAPFAEAVARNCRQRPVVVVHGGGRDLTRLLGELGHESRFVDGLRVTDDATLDAAEMVLSGRVNKRIVRALARAGVPAVGIAGTDGGLLAARPFARIIEHLPNRPAVAGLGHVGVVEQVSLSVLNALWAGGFVPVVSPVAQAADHSALNVNADHAAAAIAAALGAELRILTDVAGLVVPDIQGPLDSVSASGARELIRTGVVADGMVPKLEACMLGLQGGARGATIQGLVDFVAGGFPGTRVRVDVA